MSRERHSSGKGSRTNLGRIVVPGRNDGPPARVRTTGQLVKSIFASPDPRQKVREMAVQDLFLLVKNTGLSDAVELVELAHPEQVQRMLDLDVWTKDRIDTSRYAEWLAVIMEAYSDKLERILDDLDIEPLLVFLKKHAQFHVNSEEMPEAFREHLLDQNATETPDGMFYLEIPQGDPHDALIRLLVDRLYRADMKQAQALILMLMAELPSQLEETAYRIRSGRLEELGFFEYYEALGIYRPLPSSHPVARRSGRQSASGSIQLSPTRYMHRDRHAFLAEAIQRFSERYADEDLSFDLLTLTNRVMIAERLDLDDPEQHVQAAQIVLDLVGLGLELVSRGKLESAVEALRSIQVEWFFRLAHTRTLELQKRARRIERSLRSEFRRLPGPHADSPQKEVLEGLKGIRPQYFRGLDPDSTSEDFVTFHAPAQLDRVAAELDTLRAVYRFVFSHLAIEPLQDDALERGLARTHQRLTPGGVLLTAMARRMLGGPMEPRPLSEDEFRTWLARAFEGPHRPGALRDLRADVVGELRAAACSFDEATDSDPPRPGHVERFVMRLLEETRGAYGALDDKQPVNPLLAGGPLYLTDEA